MTTPFRDQVTLHELIAAQCALHPARTAVICDHDPSLGQPSISYSELQERVNRLAGTLRAEGVGPGQIVALMVERSFAMIIGILAILEAGAAYLPIAPDSPPDRTAYLLRDGGVQVLLVHSKTAGRTPLDGRTIDIDDPAV